MPIEIDIPIPCREISTLRGHFGIVNSVVFNPDGSLLATSSADNTAKLWRVNPDGSAEKTPVATLSGHSMYVNSVAFHPTLPLLATGAHDRTAKLWRVNPDGSCATPMTTLSVHSGDVNSVAFHRTLSLIATCYDDKTAKLWLLSSDGSTATSMATLKGHSDVVTNVAFHPKLPLLATASEDKTVKLWRFSPDGSAATCVATLEGHSHIVWSVAFHPTLPLIATGSKDYSAMLWLLNADFTDETLVSELRGWSMNVYSVAFHPTAPLLATSHDTTVMVWHLNLEIWYGSTATPIATLRHRDYVHSVAFHPTLPVLATGSWDYTAKLWDISKILQYLHNLRRIAITRAGLTSRLIKAFTTENLESRVNLRFSNAAQGRIGNPPDMPYTIENRAILDDTLRKKYAVFSRGEAVALHQPGAPLTSMSVDSSASLRPSTSSVQLQPSQELTHKSQALSNPQVLDVSSVCRPDDKECNAVYDSKFWDIVKEMHISCSDRSEILKKIEELKGYRALLIEQGNPPGITSIWIKNLEEKIKGCRK